MAASPESSRIGFAGLGNIGRPMAATLLRAGWSVTVLDTAPGKAESLQRDGARVAGSAADLADCDTLVLVVPDDAAVESILEGPDGWLAAGGDGEGSGSGSGSAASDGRRTVVVHSTIMPETAARLARVAADRGVAFLDAPVSGGADRADKGDLTIMVGGEAAALEAVRPLLDTMGSQVLLVGPAGAGAATKLANQLMMLAALAGAMEAMELAAAYGVAEDDVLESVASSTGDSWVTRNWGFFDKLAADYDAGGTPPRERPWSKDLYEVVAAARAVDLRVPVAGLLAQTLADRVEAHAARTGTTHGGEQ
jgi:3-hydroxyisobutyrate dehydrogenase-like beta-hydroxyacid dehydrogenase